MTARSYRSVMPWQVCAVVCVLAGSLAFGHNIEHEPKIYLESATVVFLTQKVPVDAADSSITAVSLVTTAAIITKNMMSPQTQILVRRAGGTANFNLTLVNFYNQDYPEYNFPFAALTARGVDPVATRRTFEAAVRVLEQLVKERQARISAKNTISMRIIGGGWPMVQGGSLKRSFVALGLLAVIAISVLSGLVKKHWDWLAIRWPRRSPARHRISRAS